MCLVVHAIVMTHHQGELYLLSPLSTSRPPPCHALHDSNSVHPDQALGEGCWTSSQYRVQSQLSWTGIFSKDKVQPERSEAEPEKWKVESERGEECCGGPSGGWGETFRTISQLCHVKSWSPSEWMQLIMFSDSHQPSTPVQTVWGLWTLGTCHQPRNLIHFRPWNVLFVVMVSAATVVRSSHLSSRCHSYKSVPGAKPSRVASFSNNKAQPVLIILGSHRQITWTNFE